jgi:hypothetical protein
VLDQGGGRRVSGWRPCRVKVVAGERVVAVSGGGGSGSGRPCWGRGGSGQTGSMGTQILKKAVELRHELRQNNKKLSATSQNFRKHHVSTQ